MAQNAFNAQSRTVVDLLGSNAPLRLVVPIFQRGYSWETKHVKAFWSDITDSNRPIKYFMGPIVVLEKPDDGISELLDGQQRLATITILFSVIRDTANKLGYDEAKFFAGYIQRDFVIGEEGRRNMQLGETDDAYFRESIQQTPQIGDKPSKRPKKRSHRFIFEARTFLADAVAKALSGKDGAESLKYLRALRDYVRHNLILACITVGSDDDAFQIFETLNDRGLRLSTPDLLLNFLMRQAKDNERKHVRQIWDEMLAEMGRRDISRFLRHLWVSQHGDLKSEGLFPALKAAIKASSVSSLNFVQQCAEECRFYVALLDAQGEVLGNAEPYVKKLIKGIDSQSSLPLLLSSLARFSLV